VVAKAPLPPAPGKSLAPARLRQVPAGTLREIVVKGQLNGPIEGLGERFWSLVTPAIPQLQERFDRKSPLAAVEYRDRYLSSPLNVLLLSKILESIATRFGKPSVLVETVDTVKTSFQRPSVLQHDWHYREHRNKVIQALLGGFSRTLEIRELPHRKTQHARDLTLRWADGTSWSVRLDHGIGFLRPRRVVSFDFEAPPETQSQRLVALSFLVENQMEEQGTFAYLTDVRKL
jgi:hypothetical protein